MHHAGELYGYFRALARATPRVRVETIGTTEEGREIILVSIADSAVLAGSLSYRAALARLADPRRTPPAALLNHHEFPAGVECAGELERPAVSSRRDVSP